MIKKLSIIIPFLNEGLLLLQTIQSIKDVLGNDVYLVIINDNSNDNYDYTEIKNYLSCNDMYIENKTRKGVAESRNLGVSLALTDYILIIDAHMKFYDGECASKIIQAIDDNPTSIGCTVGVHLDLDGNIYPNSNYKISQGTYFKFEDKKQLSYVDSSWMRYRPSIIKYQQIPCIMGATYFCSKQYYQYLNGLSGLRQYGADEAYLSLKSWLSGGDCIILNTVKIGHKYRTKSPYEINSNQYNSNKLTIAYICLNREPEIFSNMVPASDTYNLLSSFNEMKQTLDDLKTKFISIQKFSLEYFKKINTNINTECNTDILINFDNFDNLQTKHKSISLSDNYINSEYVLFNNSNIEIIDNKKVKKVLIDNNDIHLISDKYKNNKKLMIVNLKDSTIQFTNMTELEKRVILILIGFYRENIKIHINYKSQLSRLEEYIGYIT